MDIVKFFEDFFSTGTPAKIEQPVEQQPATQPPVTKEPAKPDYYERLKFAESSGMAEAKSKTSSATGHHQFLEGTWKELVSKYGKNYKLEDRKDPAKSLEIAKLFTEENKALLSKALKRDPTDTELYAAHFLGAYGAKKFLMSSPFKKATEVVNKNQVAKNKAIFFDPKTKKPRTVAQVHEILKNKIKE